MDQNFLKIDNKITSFCFWNDENKIGFYLKNVHLFQMLMTNSLEYFARHHRRRRRNSSGCLRNFFVFFP